MGSMGATFDTVFAGFVDEAKKAFPGDTAVPRAEALYGRDPERARTEFAEDLAPAMHLAVGRDDALLDHVGRTRLFEGFRVPEGTPPANRVAVMDYVAQLASIACIDTLVPESALGKLGTVFEGFRLPEGPDGSEDFDLARLLSSEEGRKLTAEVAGVMGLDVDLESPEAKQAMVMMQAMLF